MIHEVVLFTSLTLSVGIIVYIPGLVRPPIDYCHVRHKPQKRHSSSGTRSCSHAEETNRGGEWSMNSSKPKSGQIYRISRVIASVMLMIYTKCLWILKSKPLRIRNRRVHSPSNTCTCKSESGPYSNVNQNRIQIAMKCSPDYQG